MPRPKAAIRDSKSNEPSRSESILYACLPNDIVVIRIVGRGNHLNSLTLRRIFDATCSESRCPQYVFDLDGCTTMDSTFMGVLASMALAERSLSNTRAIAANIPPHVREQLELLGLKYILDMRDDRAARAACRAEGSGGFEKVDPPATTRLDRILMMIEAHETLVDIDDKNEVKFKGVLESLQDSLDKHPHS